MSDFQEAIKHFKSLQKRYTTQHNGRQCEFVKTALSALEEKEKREQGCEGCEVYSALQRYHRAQEQCPDCKGCIRIAVDRYQGEQ